MLTNRSTSNGPTRCRSQSRDDVLVKVADRTTSRARSSCRGVAVGAAGRGDTARDGVAAGADARGAGVTEVVADTVGGGALCSAEPPQLTSSGTASRTKPARIIWCSFLPAGLARPAESRPYPGSGCLCALARRDEPLKTLCPASCGCSMATADNLCSGSAPTTTAPSCRPPTTVWTRDRARGCRSNHESNRRRQQRLDTAFDVLSKAAQPTDRRRSECPPRYRSLPSLCRAGGEVTACRISARRGRRRTRPPCSVSRGASRTASVGQSGSSPVLQALRSWTRPGNGGCVISVEVQAGRDPAPSLLRGMLTRGAQA